MTSVGGIQLTSCLWIGASQISSDYVVRKTKLLNKICNENVIDSDISVKSFLVHKDLTGFW